jgi:UDP-N-acetylglucosamine acyltransferase
MKIHPTAIVSPKARLGANIEIGARAIIEDDVTIGNDCKIQANAVLTSRVTLGARNLVGYGAIIGAAPQDFAHDESIVSEVIVGDDNVLREYVTIHRGTKAGTVTRIGNGNLLMVGVHAGHNTEIGDRNVIANNCLLAGYVRIGDDVVLGGGAVFHQFIRIGSMAMVRGGTAWSKDIPPFTVGKIINVVCGINALGMRRKGISREGRQDVKRAYNLVYRSGLNVTQAVAEGRTMEWLPEAALFLDFVGERSKRGLCAARGANAAVMADVED